MKNLYEIQNESRRLARLLSLCLFLVIIGASFVGCKNDGLAPSNNSSSNAPGSTPTPVVIDIRGYIDGIDQDGNVMGWALSNSLGAQSIEIAVYVDGDSHSGTALPQVPAASPRPDLYTNLGVLGDHGYNFPIPDSLKDHKNHALHVYGVGATGLVEVGNSPMTFNLASMEPEGFLDLIDQNGVAAGWAMVPELAPNSIDVHFFVDGSPGTGVDIGTVTANMPRADVNATLGFPGDHGFNFNIPDQLKDGLDHQLYVYGMGPHDWMPLSQTPMTFHFAPKGRTGIPHIDGRNIVDDGGAFYPLGATLMWAIRGWKFEPDRIKANLQFLASHHWDYIRILGEVDWAGNNIDPTWPDYEQDLGELIDYAYDNCGLRTEITLVGGNDNIDYMGLAQKVANVVSANRQQKIMDFEVANESSLRAVTLDQMKQMGTFLRQTFPQNLVAISSVEGLDAYIPGADSSDSYISDLESVYLSSGTANFITVHMDRDDGDDGWRPVRQPWDFKDLPFPVSHNEPIGPRSSIAEETDPVRLAMMRLTGIINGVPAYVLHNGAGVAGQVDPSHNRPANLWEVPGIDNIMNVVRGLDAWIPARSGDGVHWNNGWAGDPIVADAFWGDGDDHGVNRSYSVSYGDGWISVEDGIKGYVNLIAAQHSVLDLYDVLQGKVLSVELQAGQTYTLTPLSTDDKGYGAFVIIGHYR